MQGRMKGGKKQIIRETKKDSSRETKISKKVNK